jgi:adenine-specific DNA-methyltransferase
MANLLALDNNEKLAEVAVEDMVVVAEFHDPIYPGLLSTGRVERGGAKPFHTLIKSENFHALEALLFTHRGGVDAIYIDPPYNTGARDWKYSNDYVELDDAYRHSKWLAFMERRLLLAKELLNPRDSILIVTIDEKEVLRLGLLLEQVFPGEDIQMVTSVIAPSGSSRRGRFSRAEEYLFYVFLGEASISHGRTDMLRDLNEEAAKKVRWTGLSRGGEGGLRADRPNLFYPIFLEMDSGKFHSVGDPLPPNVQRDTVVCPSGTVPVFPLNKNGKDLRWRLSPPTLRSHLEKGYAKFGKRDEQSGFRAPMYLQSGTIDKVESGEITILGRDAEGALILEHQDGGRSINPLTVWNRVSHSASDHATAILKALIPNRKFPFPKSLYAVEDSLRFAVGLKPEAVILDFFSGSGTTAHAVMRLNKQDGGERQSISITNNEVSSDEQRELIAQKLRPGDQGWDNWGICDFITKPRITAAVKGRTPEGQAIKGDYKFVDEFPMAEGFMENVEFFTLTYQSRLEVEGNNDFERMAPLLWLRAGATGRRIESLAEGWDVSETYGVLSDLDKTPQFVKVISGVAAATHAFIFTDEDRLFESVTRSLPEHIEVVRMNDAYLRNSELEAMAVTR